MLELNKLYLMDCIDGMKQFPDKYFSLALVDPPYGIDYTNRGSGDGTKTKHRWINHEKKEWDKSIPSAEYFIELKRVSVNQIIWGGNYMIEYLESSRCWLMWDKIQTFSLADFELAWTSLDSPCRAFRYSRGQATNDKKHQAIHPTQKPIKLYKWILHNYAVPNMVIIDTHVGSGSSIIAFLDFGCEWIGFEIDEDYHRDASKRIEIHKQQLKLF